MHLYPGASRIGLLEECDIVVFLLSSTNLQITGHVSFFSHGVMLGKHLVCVVKFQRHVNYWNLFLKRTLNFTGCYKEFYIGKGLVSLHF
ncbi:hypothetical protein E4T56_gene9393 [Termitomyces sp. T112]|nr:hypothetical protein E4T56_gene9393 [Termitomyces sp. T112]